MSKTNKRFHREPCDTNRLDIYRFKPRTSDQEDAHTIYHASDLTCLLGVAGTGKTYVAVALAVEDLLAKRAEKIVITRPIVEAGESLGFLPGTFEEKVDPYMRPIYDSIAKIAGKNEGRKKLISNSIEVAPLAYLRGRTLDKSVVILDEAQNATWSQLKMFVTRIGEGSKMILTGDPDQSDLPTRDVCFGEFVSQIRRVDGVGYCRFDESAVVRHPLIGRLLRAIA